MKQYIKYVDGNAVIKKLSEISVTKNDMITYNPTEKIVLEDGWVEYVAPEPSAEELLDAAKKEKLNALYEYDSSSKINNCIIVFNDTELDYWANKVERDALKGAVHDCMTMGRNTYRLDLRDKDISVTLDCDTLLLMLAQLEIYTIDCYNKTTDHEFTIKSLTTIDEINNYEFDGYPSPLQFNL